MEAAKREVKSGAQYDHLFPRAKGTTKTIKREANVSDTVHFIPKVVRQTLHHTALLLPQVKGKSIYETCRNIWDFVYDHITYEKDAHGMEQIRSPARAWADRKQGVDCDCYTTFISSILTNLRIPHTLRITKYKQDRFQHIYPVVPTKDGSYITIDCVVHAFDYEEPYTEKKDYKMDLQYLDGINDEDFNGAFEEMFGQDDELGKLKINLPKINFKKISIKTILHATNKLNPATVLLRTGLLASMKLNIMKVAGKLRWAYLSEEQAKQKGMIVENHRKLKQVLTKLENIFYGAGGKPENLKKAILSGRGNKDHSVAGFGDIDESLSESMPLDTLLGEDIYSSEMQGLEGLGEPVTAASIAAATGAIAAIATLVKNVGNVFPKGDPKNESGQEEGNPAAERVEISSDGGTEILPGPPPAGTSAALVPSSAASEDAGGNTGQENFWDKNKKWLKPTLIGAGGLTALFLGYKAFQNSKGKQKRPAMSGLAGTKRKKHKKYSGKRKGKTPIALM